jgi:hypothetical protein
MRKITLICLLLGTSNAFAYGETFNNNDIGHQRQQQLLQFNQDLTAKEPAWPNQNFNLTTFGNFDVTPKTMQKTTPGEENNYFALSNVGMNLDAQVEDFFLAHIGAAYFQTNKGQGDRYNNTGLMLDDATFTLANFSQSPLFLQGGQFYLPFGEYDRYAAIPTLTQILSIERTQGAQLGFVDWHDFTGSVYLANGQLKRNVAPTAHYRQVQNYLNYGAALHFEHDWQDTYRFGAGVEYIYNMLNVNAISESAAFSPPNCANYDDALPGISTQAEVGYKWFTVYGQYVTALKTSDDIINYYQQPNTLVGPVYGAKPAAWDAGAKANFKLYNHTNQIDFTYSHSYDTEGLHVFNSIGNHGVPEKRYIAGYTFDFTSKVYARFEWGHNDLYKVDKQQQGDDVILRLGTKF